MESCLDELYQKLIAETQPYETGGTMKRKRPIIQENTVLCESCGEMVDLSETIRLDDGSCICAEHYIDHPMLACGLGVFPEGCDPYS